MTKRYEYFTGSEDAGTAFSEDNVEPAGQSFTVGTVGDNENFTLEEIRLGFYRNPSITSAACTIDLNSASYTSGTLQSWNLTTSDIAATANNGVSILTGGTASCNASQKYYVRIKNLTMLPTGGDYITAWSPTGSYAGGENYENGTAQSSDLYFEVYGTQIAGSTSSQTSSEVLSLTDTISIEKVTASTYFQTSSETISLVDSISVVKATGSSPQTYSQTSSETMSLSDTISISKLGDATGSSDKNSVYVNNSGTWILFDHYDKFRVLKRQNQTSEFEIQIFDITDVERVYFKEQAEILFFAGTKMILKGRIQNIEYGTTFECIARGFGMEAILSDKEFIKSSDKRVEYLDTSAQTIAKEVLSVNANGSSPWTMQPDTGGIFSSDYGNLTMRFEYTNKLNALGSIANALDYEWWISQTSTDNYNEDYFHLATIRGVTTSAKTFTISGTGENAIRTSREKDITNMANYVTILGYGDGDNQLKISTYAASTQSSFLSADLTSDGTTVSLLDASSFPNTGTARISEEQFTYSGKSTNNLTGVSRGVNSTIAEPHKKGVYAELYYTTTSPQTGSSMQTYGLIESTQIDTTLTDKETAELVATGFLKDHVDPIERIKVIPYEPIEDASLLDIGDMITITDNEAGIDDDYRIVGIEYRDEYGVLSMEMEVSNVTLEFIEQMQKEKQQNQDLQKYMQGSSDSLTLNSTEDCDKDNPLYFKYYLPESLAAVNETTLRYVPSNSQYFFEQTTSAISFLSDAFPTTPKVHILVGPESSETPISGSPFNVTSGSSVSIDLTDEINAVGAGNWVGVKIIPTGSDITRMRLNGSIYQRQFIKSQ